jgi:hypothetical protein
MVDSGDQDVGLLGEMNWKSLALNREERKKLLKKARVHTGLSNQLMDGCLSSGHKINRFIEQSGHVCYCFMKDYMTVHVRRNRRCEDNLCYMILLSSLNSTVFLNRSITCLMG